MKLEEDQGLSRRGVVSSWRNATLDLRLHSKFGLPLLPTDHDIALHPKTRIASRPSPRRDPQAGDAKKRQRVLAGGVFRHRLTRSRAVRESSQA